MSKKNLASVTADATSGMFTGAVETKKTTPKKATPKKAEPEEKKSSKEVDPIFSCRMSKDLLARWKAYSTAMGYGNIKGLTETAITDYIEAHPLDPEQVKAYELAYELNKSKL